jgi:hypothetical protein
MKPVSCYSEKQPVVKNDLLVALSTEHNLTEGRVYVALTNLGNPEVFVGCVKVKNDKGVIEDYSTEWFRFYQGEKVSL